MNKYRAVFEMEIEAEDWKQATEYFEYYLKEMGLFFYDYGIKGKLLEEVTK